MKWTVIELHSLMTRFYLEFLVFVQQSVVLSGKTVHLLLYYICLGLGFCQSWKHKNKTSIQIVTPTYVVGGESGALSIKERLFCFMFMQTIKRALTLHLNYVEAK